MFYYPKQTSDNGTSVFWHNLKISITMYYVEKDIWFISSPVFCCWKLVAIRNQHKSGKSLLLMLWYKWLVKQWSLRGWPLLTGYDANMYHTLRDCKTSVYRFLAKPERYGNRRIFGWDK